VTAARLQAVTTALSFAALSCAGAHGASHTSTELRLDPDELGRSGSAETQAGTSGVVGIQSHAVNGDPTSAGLYTIRLTVPANTRIEAHQHPDDRSAVVMSGTWYFGYGEVFAEEKLRALAPGSFYTEPPGTPHFARTGDSPVVVLITGFGPTGTTYLDPAHDPR
jgi:uncharacterized RmlC-like cupin family protein